MWKEGNEFPLCVLILHGCGHVEENFLFDVFCYIYDRYMYVC